MDPQFTLSIYKSVSNNLSLQFYFIRAKSSATTNLQTKHKILLKTLSSNSLEKQNPEKKKPAAEFCMTVNQEDTCPADTGTKHVPHMSPERMLLRGGSHNQLSVEKQPPASCSGKREKKVLVVLKKSSCLTLFQKKQGHCFVTSRRNQQWMTYSIYF